AVLVSRGCDPGDPGLRTRGPAGTAYDHGMSASGTDTSAQRLYFDDFVLDLKRGCLLRAEQEIPLRPKTFAVLQFLVEHAGRLVSKEELLAAVWPNLVVTDDTLVQSIGELRRLF